MANICRNYFIKHNWSQILASSIDFCKRKFFYQEKLFKKIKLFRQLTKCSETIE